MKKTINTILSLLFLTSIHARESTIDIPVLNDTVPSYMKGSFIDDYGIQYQISDTLWTQLPGVRYHIIKWSLREQYLIVRNDNANPSEPGRYTRIDVMNFEHMSPFLWGFCLTRYDALTDEEAEKSVAADRKNPRKGCNGYPFSRMKPQSKQ